MSRSMHIQHLVLWSLLACALPAQTWARVDDVPTGLGAVVHDQALGRTFAFTDLPATVWTRDGTGWRQDLPDDLGASTVQFAVYDPARGQGVVVVDSLVNHSQTLVSHGARWLRVNTTGPAPAPGASAAFDPVGNRVIAFGGYDSMVMNHVDATLSWDGAHWTPLSPGLRPPPRRAAAMATDPVRRRVVLFGGEDQNGLLGDTWEWDGSQWQLRASTGPSPRFATMAFDPVSGRSVLLGGSSNTAWLADCWAWDGATWSPWASLPEAGIARGYQDGASLFAVTPQANVWRWTGQAWAAVVTTAGPVGWGAVAVYDPTRGEVLRYERGASQQTWAWDGSWRVRSSTGPTAQGAMAMAPLGSDVILFGGMVSSPFPPGYGYLDETWRWNGQTWSQLLPALSPPHRLGHAMVAVGSQLLLFGGDSPSGQLADTWRFDGVNWTQLQPANAPSARAGHSMAYDPLRQCAVLFGGNQTLDDTWEWNGSTWTEIVPTNRPFGGSWQMVFDTVAGNVLLAQFFSGWRWNGSDWIADPQAQSPSYSTGGMAWHAGRQRLLLSDSGWTWLYGPTPAAVRGAVSTCGSRPDLSLFGRPGIGRSPSLHLDGTANAPALVVFSLQQNWVQLGQGCYQFVGAVAASSFGLLDARGEWSASLTVPALLSLRGATVQLQGAVLDMGPVLGVSLTGALQLVVGD